MNSFNVINGLCNVLLTIIGSVLILIVVYLFKNRDNSYIKEIDQATFKYLGGGYAKDIHDIYYEGDKLSKKINIETFKYLGGGYAKDIDNFYYEGEKIKEKELGFKYLGGNYIKYKNKIYWDYH